MHIFHPFLFPGLNSILNSVQAIKTALELQFEMRSVCFLDRIEVPPNAPIVASLSRGAAGSIHIVIKLSKHVLKSKEAQAKILNAVLSRYVLLLVVDSKNGSVGS